MPPPPGGRCWPGSAPARRPHPAAGARPAAAPQPRHAVSRVAAPAWAAPPVAPASHCTATCAPGQHRGRCPGSSSRSTQRRRSRRRWVRSPPRGAAPGEMLGSVTPKRASVKRMTDYVWFEGCRNTQPPRLHGDTTNSGAGARPWGGPPGRHRARHGQVRAVVFAGGVDQCCPGPAAKARRPVSPVATVAWSGGGWRLERKVPPVAAWSNQPSFVVVHDSTVRARTRPARAVGISGARHVVGACPGSTVLGVQDLRRFQQSSSPAAGGRNTSSAQPVRPPEAAARSLRRVWPGRW